MSPFALADLRLTPYSNPSQAILTVGRHFVLVKARYGRADLWEEMVSVLNRVEKVQADLDRDNELLEIRGFWEDDKNGGLTAYVDLLHYQDRKPSIDIDRLRMILGDEELVGLSGMALCLKVHFVGERLSSDSFFPTADKYYVSVRSELGWAD